MRVEPPLSAAQVEEAKQIADHLVTFHHGRRNGDEVRFRCLWHDDEHPSAAWNQTKAVGRCYACGESFRSHKLKSKLGMTQDTYPGGYGEVFPGNISSTPPKAYKYRDPNTGEVQGIHWRQDSPDTAGKKKRIWWTDGTGRSRHRPANMWPIYGDYRAASEADFLFVVEGEKCVEAIQEASEREGLFAIALTVGGSADFLGYPGKQLAKRILELDPSTVILWPDNDPPGAKAMEAVATHLRELEIPYLMVNPAAFDFLPPGGDVVDYLESGRTLTSLVDVPDGQSHFRAAATTINTQSDGTDQDPLIEPGLLDRLVDQTPVISPDQFVFPGTHKVIPLVRDFAAVLLLDSTGKKPSRSEANELLSLLQHKGIKNPTPVAFRRHFSHDEYDRYFLWSSRGTQPLWRVDSRGITSVPNIGDPFIITQDNPNSVYSPEVAPSGTADDFYGPLDSFGLSPQSLQQIEVCLVMTLMGYRPPVLLFKSPQGQGKTTLAHFVQAILDPSTPEVSLAENVEDVVIHQILEQSIAVTFDNIGSLSTRMEDLFGGVVTGANQTYRPKYGRVARQYSPCCLLIFTSISYTPIKSDFDARVVTIRPEIGFNAADARVARRMIGALPRARGYIFNQAVKVYRALESNVSREFSGHRITEFAMVGGLLGYNPESWRQDQVAEKDQAMEEDPWREALLAVCDSYRASGLYRDGEGPFLNVHQLRSEMEFRGSGELPSVNSPKWTTWLTNNLGFMAQHGYQLKYSRGAQLRGWQIKIYPDPNPNR